MKEIYLSGELQEAATIRKIRMVENKGGRSGSRRTE